LPGGTKSAGNQGSGNDPSSTMRDTGSTRRASGLLEPPVERGRADKADRRRAVVEGAIGTAGMPMTASGTERATHFL